MCKELCQQAAYYNERLWLYLLMACKLWYCRWGCQWRTRYECRYIHTGTCVMHFFPFLILIGFRKEVGSEISITPSFCFYIYQSQSGPTENNAFCWILLSCCKISGEILYKHTHDCCAISFVDNKYLGGKLT